MISRNIVINANYRCHFLDEILSQFHQAKHLQEEPALKVYHKTLQMLQGKGEEQFYFCLLYTSPSPRDATLSRMPSSA